MKTFRPLLFLLGSFFLASSFSNYELPKDVERKLRRDAARLALRIEIGNEDARYAQIAIPAANMRSVFNALAAVYQTSQGSALYRCNINTFPNPSIDRIVLIFDRDVAWATPLHRGLQETSSVELTKLMQQHKLLIEKHVQWTDRQDALTLRAQEPINVAALKDRFLAIDGVSDCDLGIPKILGNDIQAIRLKNGWSLQYILRFGAWANGTGQSHVWRFEVNDQGQVTEKGQTGDPVPTWMKCGLEPDDALVLRL